MWTLEEFETIYAALGGHAGSYASLWSAVHLRNMNIEEAIRSLKDRAYERLFVCLRDVPSDAETVEIFFCTMSSSHYVIHHKDNNSDLIHHLASCNLLFIKANNVVYPQNQLLEHAISRYLNNYKNNCKNNVGK